MTDLRRMTREFLLGERRAPSLASYLQSIAEVLDSVTPRSQRDGRRIEMAKKNLREVRRHARRLEERVNVLEEQIQVLEGLDPEETAAEAPAEEAPAAEEADKKEE